MSRVYAGLGDRQTVPTPYFDEVGAVFVLGVSASTIYTATSVQGSGPGRRVTALDNGDTENPRKTEHICKRRRAPHTVRDLHFPARV